MHIKNLERQISKSSIQIWLSPSPVQLLSLSLSSAVRQSQLAVGHSGMQGKGVSWVAGSLVGQVINQINKSNKQITTHFLQGYDFLDGYEDPENCEIHNFSIHVLRDGTIYRLMELNQMPEGQVTHLPILNRRTSVASLSILVSFQQIFQTMKLSSSSLFQKQHINQYQAI